MLFIPDKSLAKNLGSRHVRLALDHIALGRREGKHLIFCEKRDIMKAFADCGELDTKARATYGTILNKHWSFTKACYDMFILHARVVAKDTGGVSWRSIGNKKEIKIPAELINDSAFIQKTILLCENETDCKLYVKMAETAMKRRIKIHCERRGGGGSTTADIYKGIREERKRLCLCLADSDRDYPEGPLGDTSRKLEKADTPDETLCKLKIIGVRELENLISTAMFGEVSSSDRMECIDFLEKLERTSSQKAREFLDLKKGLNGHKLFSFLAGNHPPDYWQNFFNAVRSFKANMKKECVENRECPTSDKNCICFVMKGLGDNISEAVLEMLDRQSCLKISEMLSEELKPYWKEYGELVAAWCCGAAPIVT